MRDILAARDGTRGRRRAPGLIEAIRPRRPGSFRAVSATGASGTAGIDAAPFVAALLAHGANPDQRDDRGRSPRAAAKRGAFGPAPRR
jgi:hypothetical protein